MTVAVLSTPASMTAEQYHRISERVDASRTGTPPGRRFHACFGHGDQLMVFDVWDSIEELDTFTATLTPILDIEHIDMAVAGAARDPRPRRRRRLEGAAKMLAELRDKAFFLRPVEKLLHSVKGKTRENQHPGETPTSAR